MAGAGLKRRIVAHLVLGKATSLLDWLLGESQEGAGASSQISVHQHRPRLPEKEAVKKVDL